MRGMTATEVEVEDAVEGGASIPGDEAVMTDEAPLMSEVHDDCSAASPIDHGLNSQRERNNSDPRGWLVAPRIGHLIR